jgi:hypothetical protein
MGVQELWVFAIDVTGNVAGVAANAIHVPYVSKAKLSPAQVSQVDKIRMVNLSFLAGKLIGVKYALQFPSSCQEDTIARRLPGLLMQLEQVCKVRAQLRHPISEKLNATDLLRIM